MYLWHGTKQPNIYELAAFTTASRENFVMAPCNDRHSDHGADQEQDYPILEL